MIATINNIHLLLFIYYHVHPVSHTDMVPLILSYKYGHTNIILHSMSYITSSPYLVLHILFYIYCLEDLDMPLSMGLSLPLVRSQHTQFFAFCELSSTTFIVFVIISLFFFTFNSLHFIFQFFATILVECEALGACEVDRF
jgi:hypothetical protein